MSWFYTVKPVYKDCSSREELLEYINKYPRKLDKDFFMGFIAWYDFQIAPYWPEALRVASYNVEYEESGWQVCINAEDVYNSRIPNRWAVWRDNKWLKTENGKIVE